MYLAISRLRHRPHRGNFGIDVIYSETIGKHTDVVIEGSPRSGNTFAVVAFKLAQKQPVRVAHHLHAAAQVTTATRMGVPAIVLLRNPEDAVTSHVASFGVPMRLAISEYIQFYQDVMPVKDYFVLAKFETLVESYSEIVEAANSKFNTDFDLFEHTPKNVARCFETIDNYYETISRRPKHAVARPSSERKTDRESARIRFCSSEFEELRVKAYCLYENIIKVKCL